MPDYLYAVQTAVECPPYCGLLKIGRTNRPKARLSAHQIGSPIPLIFAGVWSVKTAAISVRLETACHRKFKDRHSHGEWFAVPVDAVAAFVAEMAREQSILFAAAFDGTIPGPPAEPACFGIGAIAFRGAAYFDERRQGLAA